MELSEQTAREGLALCEAGDDNVALGRALSNFGLATIFLGRVDEGKVTLERSIEVLRGSDGPWSLAVSLMNLGAIYAQPGGELARGLALGRETHTLFTRCGDPLPLALSLGNAAEALFELGSSDEAAEAGLEALAEMHGYPGQESGHIEFLARMIAEHNPKLAARLLGYGAALWRRHPLVVRLEQEPKLLHRSQDLRRQLGDEAFENCWQQGATLAFDHLTEALHEAVRSAGRRT